MALAHCLTATAVCCSAMKKTEGGAWGTATAFPLRARGVEDDISGSIGDTGTVGDESVLVGGMRSPAVVESTGVSMMGRGPGSTVGGGITMTKIDYTCQ